MDITDYAPGNTCMLKSGSPQMTIRSIDETTVLLVYFDEVKREFVYPARNHHEFTTCYELISR